MSIMEESLTKDHNDYNIIEDYNKKSLIGEVKEPRFQKQWDLIKTVLSKNVVKGFIFIVIFSIAIPAIIYYFVIDDAEYLANDTHTCSIDPTYRIPCGRANLSQNKCVKLKCCYDKPTKLCYHYLPSKYSYERQSGTEQYRPSQKRTPLETEALDELLITVDEINENTVSLILHEPNERIINNVVISDKRYKATVFPESLVAEIYRAETLDIILSTSKGPLIASEGYWEWSFQLTTEYLFGLGQNLINLDQNSTLTKVIYQNNYDHNTEPVLWAFKNGNFHAIVINHNGPLEIVVYPSKLVSLKSLTGSKIELQVSVGPTPKLIHEQLQQLKQAEINVPPEWTLQPHICRKDESANLKSYLEAFQVTEKFGTNCIHENLLMYMLTTKDENAIELVANAVGKIQESPGMKLLLSVPPQIPYLDINIYKALENLDVLYKLNGEIYIGKYLNLDVVYPDYTHESIQEAFNQLIKVFEQFNVTNIDGFVLTNNWPSNKHFLMDANLAFPYLPQDILSALSNTIPWNATKPSTNELHIIDHNTYGSSQKTSMQKYFADKLIISASNSFNVETQSISIIENVDASWEYLKAYVNNVLFKSIIGKHLVSVPICGSTKNFDTSAQETLCLRWYLIAATMPIFRVASTTPLRDSSNLNSQFAIQIATNSMEIRRKFLPYFHTILGKNEPLIRPMYYEFFNDTNTFALDEQYLIGSNLIAAHPFTANQRRLNVYLPKSIEVWFEFWAGEMHNTKNTNGWIDVDVIETDMVYFIAQGTIITLVDEKSLDMVIAQNCDELDCEANGEIQVEGASLSLEATASVVTISNITESAADYVINTIKVYMGGKPIQCTIGLHLSEHTGGVLKYTLKDNKCPPINQKLKYL